MVLVYDFLEHPQGVHSYDYLVALNQRSGWNNIYNIFQLKNICEDDMMDCILTKDSLHLYRGQTGTEGLGGCVTQPLPKGRVQIQQQRMERIVLLIQT